MKIMIVAGGTGGHIYPALTLADELKNRGHEICFIGSNERMEKDLIPERGYSFIGLDVLSTQGGIVQKVKSLLSIVKEYFHCKKILMGYDCAIGFGNYISVPVMLAAKSLGLKSAIHEQNSFVGKANRLLDKKVDLVIGSYDENLKQFKNSHTLILGNPQSAKAYGLKKDRSLLEEWGLSRDKKTVLIFMGSLGSSSINDILLKYFDSLNGDYQVVYATGREYYQNVVKKIGENNNIRIFKRVDGIKAMQACDLLVSRAGATTLAEITAMGMPAILIPSPYVPNNHQYYNALALVNKEAAILLEEKDLNPTSLDTIIREYLFDENIQYYLGLNGKKMANPNVLNDIVEEIEKL